MVLAVSDEVHVLESCDVDVCDIRAKTASSQFAWNVLLSLIIDMY